MSASFWAKREQYFLVEYAKDGTEIYLKTYRFGPCYIGWKIGPMEDS